jgi:putative membrane protein insertion efficiency factor
MNIGQWMIILLIRGYQAAISPALPVLFGPAGRCRFTPSCSQYAREAVQAHGVLAGSVLAAGRLCRCNPWGASGEDPVPAAGENRRLGLRLRREGSGADLTPGPVTKCGAGILACGFWRRPAARVGAPSGGTPDELAGVDARATLSTAANSTQPVAAVYDRRRLEGAESGPNSKKGGHGS